MADFAKLDVNEVALLAGTDESFIAAEMIEVWGIRETVITRSDGALVREDGKTYFERFEVGERGRW